jgi:predicted transcriptional regulator
MAFRANLKHGLRADKGTKGDYVYWLSLSFPDMARSEIALRAGLSQSAVSRAITKRRKEAKEQGLDDEVEELIGAAAQECKRFTQSVLRHFKQIEDLDNDTLERLLFIHVRTTEDKIRLARVGRILQGSINLIE